MYCLRVLLNYNRSVWQAKLDKSVSRIVSDSREQQAIVENRQAIVENGQAIVENGQAIVENSKR